MSPPNKRSNNVDRGRVRVDQAEAITDRRFTRKHFLKTVAGAGVALSVLGTESASAEARVLNRFEPPDGKIYTGVCASEEGDSVGTLVERWDAWTNMAGGKPAAISHTFNGFPPWFSFDFDTADARNASAALISWETDNISPRKIARNTAMIGGVSSDKHILEAARRTALWNKPVFLRVDQEMNAGWMPWCAFNRDGSPRKHTPYDFKQMWRRIHILFQGGLVREVNIKLAEIDLPPVDRTFTKDTILPTVSNVAFVFNTDNRPGVPNIKGNRWGNYYPGDAYVDWVGQTFYDATHGISMDQRFAWLERFYDKFCTPGRHNKPYMMGEWGLASVGWSGFGDHPRFIRRTLNWAEAKSKVKSIIYFEVENDRGHKVTRYPNPGLYYPNSAAKLRNRWLLDSYINTVN